MKTGDYVRTKDGFIAKLLENDNIYCFFDNTVLRDGFDDFDFLSTDDAEDYIIKSSPNIIDLLIEGDLVTLASPFCGENIYKVLNAFKGKHSSIELDCFGDGTMSIDENYEIKSIVTREQFESMEYKLW